MIFLGKMCLMMILKVTKTKALRSLKKMQFWKNLGLKKLYGFS